jgi:deoxyribonuclease V
MKEYLWPAGIEEAKELQRVLKERVKITLLKRTPEFIAAADAAFSDNLVLASATLYRLQGLTCEKNSLAEGRIKFPYVPGLLAFREGKVIIAAIRKLAVSPDVILIEGQGIAHPEGIGIASHVGVLLNIPAVGCAKSRLVGEYREPGHAKGDWSYLYYNGVKVGAVLRTKLNVKPLFISPGHLVDIESSVEIVMRCVSGYRIPEPLRTADRLSKKMKRDYSDGL